MAIKVEKKCSRIAAVTCFAAIFFVWQNKKKAIMDRETSAEEKLPLWGGRPKGLRKEEEEEERKNGRVYERRRSEHRRRRPEISLTVRKEEKNK